MRLLILVLLVLSFLFSGQLMAQCEGEKASCEKKQNACPAPGCEKGCSEVCKAVTKALKENCKACKGNCSDACMEACGKAIMACMSAGCTDCSKDCKSDACKAGCSDTCKFACEIACKTVASMKAECATKSECATACDKSVAKSGCCATAGKEKSGCCAEGKEMSMEEMQKCMEAAAKPGPQHAHFQSMAGNWDTVSTFWMEPGQAPQTSKGTNTNQVVLDGRYLVQNYKGDFMGMPFEGIGITAYNNVTQKFQMAWIDNCGTGIYTSTGTCDGTGKTVTLHGEMAVPGMTIKTREVIRMIDANKYIFEMYHTIPNTPECKVMEIVYTRNTNTPAPMK